MKLQEAVMHVESSCNKSAIRFEFATFRNLPGWMHPSIRTIRTIHNCTEETGDMIACTSFGLFQLLGANIYDLRYTATIFEFISDIDGQYTLFRKFLSQRNFDPDMEVTADESSLLAFAKFYNGPGSPELYAKALVIAANPEKK